MKRKLKKTLRVVFSVAFLRTAYVFLSLAIQIGIILVALWALDEYFVYFYIGSAVLGLILALKIVNDKSNPAYKMAWVTLILFQPVFGTMIYLLFGSGYKTEKIKRNLRRADEKIQNSLSENDELIEEVKACSPSAAKQMRYLAETVKCPVYSETNVEFLSPGEVKFERMKQELLKAEKFIFIEYFIISSGKMWDGILEILKQKAKAGVEVRVMYDDFGSMLTIPYKYGRYLESQGLKTCVFGKIAPVLSGLINHRDHRKILVIDGKVGFTGGINISDEYINEIDKHGHWKDSSIVITGKAVWSLTVFFLSTWGLVTDTNEDYSKYSFDFGSDKAFDYLKAEKGVVQPYYDSPLDEEQVGENVYLNMISNARRYVYIETPYLIIDHETIVCLCNAAKQGIDVRIVVPHVGDHWYVHATTRSNYARLTESGVRIYEYTPGFIHSKLFVCDDEIAVVGTINLDYRSLYLHFENAVLMYNTPEINQITEDFFSVLEVSDEVTCADCAGVKWYIKLFRGIIRIFAPLM